MTRVLCRRRGGRVTAGWQAIGAYAAWAVLLGSGGTTVVRAGADSAATKPAAAAPADNSYCFTCHVNFKDEPLAMKHCRKGVGCAKCHGESDRHSSDEDNVTPPDAMFAKDAIKDMCIKCHQPADLKEAEKDMDAPNHTAVLAGRPTDDGKHYCTDCHGKHALKVRTRRWDKATGKLLADDGVRMADVPRDDGKKAAKP